MKIGVAMDGSFHAERAAKYAIDLASKIEGARVELLTVVTYDQMKKEHLLTPSHGTLEVQRKKVFKRAVEWAEEANVELKQTVLKGDPSKMIMQYAEAVDLDLLVIGSRGLNALQEVVLGSVSQKLVKHIGCPVTVVK
ncbi:universal stress protein [Savagea sp. SN6]|uniref:Universal stress protein n=1 Tax=Savagea serpentis TaxID=2785297 RepID=A0A8J7G3S1_9BACL|nr:universal stress protein [Savagea serpentis]MBF4500882.1 universal stress protein [Savagea serpentis]